MPAVAAGPNSREREERRSTCPITSNDRGRVIRLAAGAAARAAASLAGAFRAPDRPFFFRGYAAIFKGS